MDEKIKKDILPDDTVSIMHKNLTQLENRRRKLLNGFKICIGLAIAVAVITLFIPAPIELIEPISFIQIFFAITFAIPAGIVSFFLSFTIIFGRKYLSFKRDFKNTVIHSILSKVFTDIDYRPNAHFDRDFIKNTFMVAIGNRFKGDDLIHAKYKNIRFSQCDLSIRHHTSSGKSSSTVTYFIGKWMVFDFNKKIDAYIQIRQRDSGRKAVKGGGIFSQKPKTEKVKFEDESFNHQFDVYTSDRHTAFYLLTPHFIDSLKRLNDLTHGQIIMGFIDGKMHVAIYSNKNSMEPSMFKPIDENYEHQILDDIKPIINFVDELKLDRNLFKETNDD